MWTFCAIPRNFLTCSGLKDQATGEWCGIKFGGQKSQILYVVALSLDPKITNVKAH